MAPSSYFADNYGEKLTNTLRAFSDKCWKRAALIIGAALAGYDTVPRPKDLPEDTVKSLGDALDKCEIDNYLLVGNKIQPLIMNLVLNNTRVLTEAFIDKYNEAINEVRRVLNIAKDRDRGVIYGAEGLYGLGLISIIANAAESGKSIKPDDADIVLNFALSAIQYVASPILTRPILRVLEPLRDKAPQEYIKLLVSALSIGNLDSIAVEYILNELNYVLSKYGDVVKGHALSLVYAIRAYANLLGEYLVYFSDKVGGVVGRVVGLLNELDRLNPSLSTIAWAYAITPALMHKYVRGLWRGALGIDAVSKASEVLEGLSKLREKVKELMRDEEFMSFVGSRFIRVDEETVKKAILKIALLLRHTLAIYRLDNDELEEASRLFNEVAGERRELGDYEGYLTARSLALRAEAIKGSLLVDEFRRLYEEAREHFKPTAKYLSIASGILGSYLVSLALTGDDKKINKLLEEHRQVLNANGQVSVLTRLTLNALFSLRGRLSSKLKGKLSVNPEELIETFNYGVDPELLPVLKVAFGITKPKDGAAMCMSINDLTKRIACMHAISITMNNDAAVVRLREQLVDAFRELLFKKLDLLRELSVDVDVLLNEFRGLMNELDGKSLIQLLITPGDSRALLALMLYALINGNKELAKAHALKGAVSIAEKLPTRLFLEVYKECRDLGSEEFRRAIAKLFFYHV